MGPSKPWIKGGEKDGALAAPALSGPEDGQAGRLGEDHGAKAGEIQEKGVMCVKGRHGGVEKVRIQGLKPLHQGRCDGRFSRTPDPV
jgi:hypothetical protein